MRQSAAPTKHYQIAQAAIRSNNLPTAAINDHSGCLTTLKVPIQEIVLRAHPDNIKKQDSEKRLEPTLLKTTKTRSKQKQQGGNL